MAPRWSRLSHPSRRRPRLTLTWPRRGRPRDYRQLRHAPNPSLLAVAPRCKFTPPRPSGSPSVHSALESWEGSGFLQLQVGPHPPGHVTGEGVAPASGREPAFRGPHSSALALGTLFPHLRAQAAVAAGNPRGQPRAQEWLWSPPPCSYTGVRAHTCSSEHRLEEHFYHCQRFRITVREGLCLYSPECFQEKQEPSILLSLSYSLSTHS